MVLVHPDNTSRILQIQQIADDHQMNPNHPDLLWIDSEKLGVEQAKQIRVHLSLKPFQAEKKMVVLVHAGNLTPDAQNALLKTLEEPEGEAIFLLGVESEDQLLPTILSRCQVVHLVGTHQQPEEKYLKEIPRLQAASMEERFQYIEKLDDRLAFYQALVYYFRHQLPAQLDFTKDLLESEQWVQHNVTIRAVLEYLMLKLPSI